MNDKVITSTVGAIVDVISRVVGNAPRPVPLHEPTFGPEDWQLVKECLDSGWVSSAGKHVDQFERLIEEYTGAAHAVATVNGTAALHVCLKLAGVRQGDEVIIPTLTFIATANAVSYCGAVPHFADVDQVALGLDPDKLSDHLRAIAEVRNGTCFNRLTGAPLRALVVMHTFGHSADLDRLLVICERYQLTLIEDAAESLGSYYKGRHTGTLGRLAALSFNGNKIITTGGGGAVLTNDHELARQAKHLTTTARVSVSGRPWSFIHDQVGFNYRLPNLNAALGCSQIARMPQLVAQKRALASAYIDAFADLTVAHIVREPDYGQSNYWLNGFLLDTEHAALRDPLLSALNSAGLGARPVWTPMHKLPAYSSCPRMALEFAEDIERRLISIPSSPALGMSKS
jgi:perosamine synthetase